MAHYEKYHMNDVIGLLCHDNRSLKTERENIDSSRSYLNYNLHNIDNEYEFFKDRLEFVKNNGGTVRDNSVVMCSIVVTLPENFPQNEELEKQFFNACYNLICDDFGKENVISGWIHYDENLKNSNRPNKPHIHLKFLPVMKTKKQYKNGEVKNRLSFNANKMIDKIYLQKFHNRLEDYIEDYIGFKAEVLNGATKYGNKTIEELKAISAKKEELEKIKSSCSNKDLELFELKEKEKERKKLVNNFWKEYQEISNNYWKNYKLAKQNINNDIFEIKRNVKSAEYQLSKDLDFFNNLNRGLLFAIVRLFVALMTYHIKDDLNAQIRQLEGELEELEKIRRSCSSYQNSSKIALKSEDLERIENSLQKWENSVKISENIIKSYFEKPNSTLKNFVRNKEKEEERF